MLVLKVGGMTCKHCEKAITEAVQERDPQATLVIDLAQGLVRVTSTLSQHDLTFAIQEAGYDVIAEGAE